MIAVLRQRDFSILWFAGLISMIGDSVLRIGLPLYVFNLTGSTLATGAMLVAGIAPGLLFGSIAGVFVDRWDRRRIMIVTNLLQVGVLLPLLTVHSAQQVWIIYVVLFTGSTISQLFSPAESALLPLLVDEEHLATANSLSALNSNLARLLGPALAGIILGLTGLAGITLIDAMSFVVAASLIVLIRYRRPRAQTQAAGVNVVTLVRGVAREWSDGLRLVRDTPPLAILFAVTVPIMIAEGFFGTLIVPFVTRVMHGTDIDFGVLMAAQGVGGIIGSITIARIARTIPAHRLLGFCLVIFGMLDLALFYYPLWITGIGPGLLFIGLVGIPGVGFFTGRTTLLQTLTSDAYRGRVLGALGALSALLMLVGAVLAGVLGERVSLILLLTVDGMGYIVAGIVALALLGRSVIITTYAEAN
jgi:Na+/melibiose symporter-like transporter